MANELNSEFWNEICGSNAARAMGLNELSVDSLNRFDEWYFGFYPYLKPFISGGVESGNRILEIGLGFGSVSQFLAQSGMNYRGIDIAGNPVDLVNFRFEQCGLPGRADVRSILEPDGGEFDTVIAIGSLHHTGNLEAAISNCHALLVPGGQLLMMVYNAYSYRRWMRSPLLTSRYLWREQLGYRGVVGGSSNRQRKLFDSNAAGFGAPHTDWISQKSLCTLLSDFTHVNTFRINIDQDFPTLRRKSRSEVLATKWGALCGLDIYVNARK